jgi:hypothetical protein
MTNDPGTLDQRLGMSFVSGGLDNLDNWVWRSRFFWVLFSRCGASPAQVAVLVVMVQAVGARKYFSESV